MCKYIFIYTTTKLCRCKYDVYQKVLLTWQYLNKISQMYVVCFISFFLNSTSLSSSLISTNVYSLAFVQILLHGILSVALKLKLLLWQLKHDTYNLNYISATRCIRSRNNLNYKELHETQVTSTKHKRACIKRW